MGLTIHYELRASADRSVDEVRRVINQLRRVALVLDFKKVGEVIELEGKDADFNGTPEGYEHRWLLCQAQKFILGGGSQQGYRTIPPQHLIAVSTWPGEGCEAANFGLCRYGKGKTWQWESFCKTQYANDPKHGGIENFLYCHLGVITVLRTAQQLGVLKSVSDEGGYWDHGNVEKLAQEIGEWDGMIANLTGRLRDMVGRSRIVSAMDGRTDFEHLEAIGESASRATNES